MEFLQKLFKDKNFKNLFFGILGFVGILYFGWGFIIAILIIALIFDSKFDPKKDSPPETKYEDPDLKELKTISEELKQLDVKKDFSKLKNISERIPGLLEDIQTPKTFYEIVGDLTIKTKLYYFKDLDQSDPIDEKYAFLKDDFEKAKDICDRFLDGNEYVKVWVIYRTLLQREVPEEEINKNFPELISKMKDIRDQKWKDVAWAYHIADEVEKVTGKDSCNKERHQKLGSLFAKDDSKERMTEKQSDEFKNDYKLLLPFDQEKIKEKDKEINNQILKNFDVEKFGGKPNKLKSIVTWEIEDAVKFGEKVREDFLDLPMLNGLGFDTSELNQKQLQFAGKIRTKDYYSSIFDDKFVDQIQSLERVSDFYQFEMFDKDPINSAIKNEDIERIIFYSLLQIPKKLILTAENISKDDPLKRAPYFGIMHIHHLIILQVLQDLGIYNKNELVISSWVTNQYTDPLDEGDATTEFLKTPSKGRYDDKFMKEIWVPLYYLLSSQFTISRKSLGDPTKVLEIADSIFQSVLNSYYLGDPKEAYAMMKPMYDHLQEQEKKRSK